MLRLTLRSGRDGRFLARIIDRDGFPFLLDYGDPRVIQDAAQRVLKGFTMWRSGKLVLVGPQDADMLSALADLYAHEGMLVFLEEPTWHGQRGAAESRPDWSAAVLEDFDDEGTDGDAPTQTVSADEFKQMVGDLHITPLPREPTPMPSPRDPTPAPAQRMYARRQLDALLGPRRPPARLGPPEGLASHRGRPPSADPDDADRD